MMHRRITIATIALICIPAIWIARAQDVSTWETAPHGAARLIAGTAHEVGENTWLRAGIEIRLEPGWHTYWRYPGDAGVPPTFDFVGSENVKSVTVLWPAPVRFSDEAGGYLNGYFGDVVFPLRIIASDMAKPSLLHVRLAYAICRDLCLPAEANLELTLSDKSRAEDAALAAAESHVPRRVPLGAGTGLAIRSVHREGDNAHRHVVVEVAAPEGTPITLFAEGPTSDWALPPPEPMPGGVPGVQRFAFELDGLPSGANTDGALLTFTAVSPDDAIEVSAYLD
jgi:DsbC/DsbD-like thiol-disulfide interchange protein